VQIIKKGNKTMNYLEKQLKEIEDCSAYNVNGRKEKFTQQLIERGFHDGDTFDLYTHLAREILPRLIRFKELAEGCIIIDFPLDDMITAFELVVQDKVPYSKEEYEIIQNGLEAFGKYFRALWW
jgi:hypothetical protein